MTQHPRQTLSMAWQLQESYTQTDGVIGLGSSRPVASYVLHAELVRLARSEVASRLAPQPIALS